MLTDCTKSTATNNNSDLTSALMQLCASRYYIAHGEFHSNSIQRGRSCGYGPLGVDLKSNIVDQWWISVMRSRAQVFGISTLQSARDKEGVRLVDNSAIEQTVSNNELTKEQIKTRLQHVLQRSVSFRTSLLKGALEQFAPSLELVNKKLPFGLAETGVCHGPAAENADSIDWLPEFTESSLVWFCTPRTSSQWLDYWSRQRLQWWRKFALGPSDFNCCDATDEELQSGASRGVKILYRFPWGTETLETLHNLGSTELLNSHRGSRTKLHCKDGRNSVVPHVISVSGNIDRGVLAYLFNSLQWLKKVDNKQKLHQRQVLKLHPTLSPVKVAVDVGRGSTMELRQVCEGLLQEFLEAGISAWPGYLDTTHSSLELMHSKYDEMGVLFTVMISENTLENGLLSIRSRDTTIRETMHISEVKTFLLKFISAAANV
ncbi:DNA polymerase subunit gamma-2, mitochondrial [Chanos chanos]|uniref:DNA polymerase subunit gamma-2, mitochondrial n=1 Tax=Chanos chanos TaxID=29144 RepID=A0A6J2VXF3_CHACN|nr:DNA polymerase subunit gamma-2, mitochondrial [Chanos chanos]